MNTPGGIAAIIVSRNRLAMLQDCIQAVRRQTRPPEEIIIVDNASDDGTAGWLAAQSGLTVISQANLGGAGGFFEGLRQAYARGHEWFWCLEDDVLPESGTLAALCAGREFQEVGTGFLASVARGRDGQANVLNLPTVDPSAAWIGQVLSGKAIPVVTASFTSLLVARRAVRECGLPLRAMFLGHEGEEYTRRLTRRFSGHLCLASSVLHASRENTCDLLGQLRPENLEKFRLAGRNAAFLVATGDGWWIEKTCAFLRQFAATTRVLVTLRKSAYFRPILGAMLQGFFSFRPEVEFVPAAATTESSSAQPS